MPSSKAEFIADGLAKWSKGTPNDMKIITQT